MLYSEQRKKRSINNERIAKWWLSYTIYVLWDQYGTDETDGVTERCEEDDVGHKAIQEK